MADPYLLPEPAVVSFSGGRTSGFMLWQILRAFGGTLPAWARVVYCNTGKEREETLRFVERVSLEWGVPITWLEYRWEPGRHYFVEVNYATASRQGEPFEAVIQARGFLPNPVMRFCTAELKIRTTNRWVRQTWGLETYHNAIGLRADEPDRVSRMRQRRVTTYTPTLWEDWQLKDTVRGSDLPPGESPLFPLHDAGARLKDVMGFWERQPFDLELRQDEGNCDLCFLKGAKKLLGIMRDRPDLAVWWERAETAAERVRPRSAAVERFRMDRPRYSELLAIARGERDEAPLYDGKDWDCGAMDECRCTD